MDKNIDERYESLKKSVNGAVKLLCNKIEDIKTEVRELKTEKVNDKINPCKICKCTKSNENMKNTVEKIERKLEEVMKESVSRSIQNLELKVSEMEEKVEVVAKSNDVETVVSEIKRLSVCQKENSEELKVIENKLSALEDEHKSLRMFLKDKVSLKQKNKESESRSENLGNLPTQDRIN